MKKLFVLLGVLLGSFSLGKSLAVNKLKELNLPGISIVAVEHVTSGTFLPPEHKDTIKLLPEFVRVAMVSRPTSQSFIRIEVWLPCKGWNGRFVGTGNGGGAGHIDYGRLSLGVRNDFAVANTDMGTFPHVDSLIHTPERWADFGYRATHEMTVAAKAVINEFYKQEPRYSYFIGCSTGGQQALMEAQRYPEDYDGILAGAPANNRTHLHAGFVWNYQVSNVHPENKLSRQQIDKITELVLRSNTGKDGNHPENRFLTDPQQAVLPVEELKGFLSESQIDVLKKIYAGPSNPVTGEQIYTSIPLGSESAGSGLFEQQNAPITYHFYPFRWVFGLDFDPMKFDFNKDMDKVDKVLAPILNANNPNLTVFEKSGGKLLMYAGLADPLVPYQDALHYYERVVDKCGSVEQTQDFFRLFLVPGMWHCGGGPGAYNIGQTISNISESADNNIFNALIQWVEQGIAPQQIIGTGYDVRSTEFQAPIYPYPLFPHLDGGLPRQLENYRAVPHKRKTVTAPAPGYL